MLEWKDRYGGIIMLFGRLGLEQGRIPHSDRHGLIWLDRGALTIEAGCLTFACAGGGMTPAGTYSIPHQTISIVMLGPGSTVSHDAMRILASHGVCLVAVGQDGVRLYTVPPLLPDASDVARRQAELWADQRGRIRVARRMYAIRLGEILPHRDLDVLRGIEGTRVKVTYRMQADRHGIKWNGRDYDRANPEAADVPNQAINHASTAFQAAAAIAVAATGAIPQLGFIHEASGASFVLDIADLYRDHGTVETAFRAVRKHQEDPTQPLERVVRKVVGQHLRQKAVIPEMIDRIKALLKDDPE